MTQAEESGAERAASTGSATDGRSGGKGLVCAKLRFIDAAIAVDPWQAVRRRPFISLAAAGLAGALLGTRRGMVTGKSLLAVTGTLLTIARGTLAAIMRKLEKNQHEE